MVAVSCQRVRADQPRQALPVIGAKAHIPPQFNGGAAGLPSSKHVPAGGPLILETDLRPAMNARFREPFHRGRRESQPRRGMTISLLAHAYLFGEIGRPSALRIISLEHPAQQMYFLGSSIEMARLSPLVSRFTRAHEGQRAIQ